MSNIFQKNLIFFTNIFFYCLISLYLFKNVDILFYFIINFTPNVAFFIIDINLFAKQYFILIRFFSYLVYFLFFIIFFRFICINRLSSEKNVIKLFWGGCILYTQILARIFVQYDFIYDYYNISNSWFEGVDFISFRIYYKGLFWDFFLSYLFFMLVYIYICIFAPNRYLKLNYGIINKINIKIGSICNPVFFSWMFRMLFYCFIYYFFGGESFISDILLRFFIVIFTELFIIIYRFLYCIAIFLLKIEIKKGKAWC